MQSLCCGQDWMTRGFIEWKWTTDNNFSVYHRFDKNSILLNGLPVGNLTLSICLVHYQGLELETVVLVKTI